MYFCIREMEWNCRFLIDSQMEFVMYLEKVSSQRCVSTTLSVKYSPHHGLHIFFIFMIRPIKAAIERKQTFEDYLEEQIRGRTKLQQKQPKVSISTILIQLSKALEICFIICLKIALRLWISRINSNIFLF